MYFVALKPEVITLCALQTLLNTMVTNDSDSDVISGQKIVTMALNMGKAIENEIIRESLLRSGKRWLKETMRRIKTTMTATLVTKQETWLMKSETKFLVVRKVLGEKRRLVLYLNIYNEMNASVLRKSLARRPNWQKQQNEC